MRYLGFLAEVSATCFHDAAAEVERHGYSADAFFDGFFNLDACAAVVRRSDEDSAADAAESARSNHPGSPSVGSNR